MRFEFFSSFKTAIRAGTRIPNGFESKILHHVKNFNFALWAFLFLFFEFIFILLILMFYEILSQTEYVR